MPIELEYDDKYSLWKDLVRSNADRLFIPTVEEIEINSTVPVNIRIKHKGIRLVVRGVVVARRRLSRRFDHGIFVHVEQAELQKSRRFLGLQPPDRYALMRRASRVHHETQVRLTNPVHENPCVTKNISDSGLFIKGSCHLAAGQRVSLELETGGEPLHLDAEVAWTAPGGDTAGLHLVDISATTQARLSELIKTAIADRRAAHTNLLPVLAVDDDPQILDFLNRAFSQHGYEFFQAVNGADALSLVQELHPELVLMDILTPRTDGVDICKYMRADSGLADIPVIYTSALEEETLRAVADETGATDYLTKPLHLAELLDMVGYYLKAAQER